MTHAFLADMDGFVLHARDFPEFSIKRETSSLFGDSRICTILCSCGRKGCHQGEEQRWRVGSIDYGRSDTLVFTQFDRAGSTRSRFYDHGAFDHGVHSL